MQTRFVAEVGSNHNGSLLRALRLVDAAADAGFWGVKTQQFEVRSLFRPGALPDEELERRAKGHVPEDWHEALAERAHSRGLKYGVTPFYESCVRYINAFVDFWKISSYDILRLRLISLVASMGKPIYISTGMATMEEVMAARQAALLPGMENRLTLLHCVSSYPTPMEQANLKAIDLMQKYCGQPIGWSDHSHYSKVITRAVWRWRASVVEMHMDLDDRTGAEAQEHCWSATQAAIVLRYVKHFHLPPNIARDHSCDGHGRKEPMPCEREERNWRADPVDGLRPLKLLAGAV